MSTSIRTTFKRRFLAGIFVLIPLIITFFILWWFFVFIDGLLEPLYFKVLGFHIPGLGFISAIVLIFIVGAISSNVFGRKLIKYTETIILKIPVFKGLYTAIKQIVDAFSPESQSSSFKKFVIVEYPRPGVFAFGFLTGECVLKKDKEKDTQESCLRVVYIPTNLIYFGDIVLFKDEEVYNTNIPIDEGLKIILSGGIATPHMISEAK
jgi:uncharacterized membrane protein